MSYSELIKLYKNNEFREIDKSPVAKKFYLLRSLSKKQTLRNFCTEFAVDEDLDSILENKLITEENIIEVTLPEVEIFTPPSIDPESLSYIPSEKEYDLKEVLETCEADVLREAEEAEELKTSATENLKAIIEALLKPIIEPEGYEIRWNE